MIFSKVPHGLKSFCMRIAALIVIIIIRVVFLRRWRNFLPFSTKAWNKENLWRPYSRKWREDEKKFTWRHIMYRNKYSRPVVIVFVSSEGCLINFHVLLLFSLIYDDLRSVSWNSTTHALCNIPVSAFYHMHETPSFK